MQASCKLRHLAHNSTSQTLRSTCPPEDGRLCARRAYPCTPHTPHGPIFARSLANPTRLTNQGRWLGPALRGRATPQQRRAVQTPRVGPVVAAGLGPARTLTNEACAHATHYTSSARHFPPHATRSLRCIPAKLKQCTRRDLLAYTPHRASLARRPGKASSAKPQIALLTNFDNASTVCWGGWEDNLHTQVASEWPLRHCHWLLACWLERSVAALKSGQTWSSRARAAVTAPPTASAKPTSETVMPPGPAKTKGKMPRERQ